MARKYKKKSFKERKKEIDDLTDRFSEKIDEYFTSESKLKEHLNFMSQFHKYSARNQALIDEQFMGARAVGGFNFWKDKGVSVKKGEKGIKILAPAPVNYYKKDGEWKPAKYANKEDKQKIKNGDYETRKQMFFKVGHVFEYTQTNARELGMETSDIFKSYHRDGTVENDKAIMNALEKVADHLDVEIMDLPLTELGTAKGVSYPTLQSVALNPRNTEYENISVLIHELAHAKMHTEETRDNFTKNEREFQAEMTAYVVANNYNIDTEDFSLSYLKSWTKDAKLNDKEQLLSGVKETAHEFINIMDQSLEKEFTKESQHESYEKQEKVSNHTNDHHLNKELRTQLNTMKEFVKNNPTALNEFSKEFSDKTETMQQSSNLKENNQALKSQLNTMKGFVKNNPKVLNEFQKEFNQENEQKQEKSRKHNIDKPHKMDMER